MGIVVRGRALDRAADQAAHDIRDAFVLALRERAKFVLRSTWNRDDELVEIPAATIFNRVESIGRQPRLRKAVRNPSNVFFSFEREPADMPGKGIVRVDLFEFVPYAPGFFDFAKMAESRGEERASRVGIRRQHEALPKNSGRCLVFSGGQIR